MEEILQEWSNNYPFAERTVPEALRTLFADLSLLRAVPTSEAPVEIRLAGVANVGGNLQLSLQETVNGVTTSTWTETLTARPAFGSHRLCQSAGSRALVDSAQLAALAPTVLNPTLRLAARCVEPRSLRVIRINALGLPSYPEVRRIRGGYNLTLSRSGNQVTLNCEPGSGLGRYENCEEYNLLGPPIRTINGRAGDARGNFRISDSACYRIGRKEQNNQVLDAILSVSGDCKACQDCDDYVGLYYMLRNVYERLAIVQAQLEASWRRLQHFARMAEMAARQSDKTSVRFLVTRVGQRSCYLHISVWSGHRTLKNVAFKVSYPIPSMLDYVIGSGSEKLGALAQHPADNRLAANAGQLVSVDLHMNPRTTSFWEWGVRFHAMDADALPGLINGISADLLAELKVTPLADCEDGFTPVSVNRRAVFISSVRVTAEDGEVIIFDPMARAIDLYIDESSSSS